MSNHTHFERQALPALQRTFLRATLRLLATLLLVPVSAYTQVTVNFAGNQTTVPATGLVAPTGVAVDSSGNLYIIDQTLTSVVMITPSGTQSTLGSGLRGPQGLAVDGFGDVYVADTGNARVVEIPAGGTQTLISSGWTAPSCVAADVYGNVYVCDSNNAIEVPAGGGSNITIPQASSSSQYVGIAVDNNYGGVYLFDRGNNRIAEWDGGSATYDFSFGTTLSGHSLSIDSQGILYVASNATNLVQAYNEDGYPTGNYGTGLNQPYAAASDGSGNIYIANFNAGASGSVYKEALGGINLGATNLCPASAPSPGNCSQTVTVNFNTTSFGSTGTETHVVTEGNEEDLVDFVPTNDTCTSASLGPNAACSVTVTFTPRAPGTRLGAVEIEGQPFTPPEVRRSHRGLRAKSVKPAITFQSSNTLQSMANVSGIGIGPLPFLEEAPIYSLPPVPSPYLSGVAVDVNENLYFVDNQNCRVYEQYLLGGSPNVIAGTGTCGSSADGSSGTATQLNPLRVAVDGRGDIYIDDQVDDAVRMLDANTGLITTVAGTLNSSGYSGDGGPATSAQLSAPADVAVDGEDNLYIADQANSSIRRVDAVTGVITTVAGSYSIGLPNPGYSGDGGPASAAQLNAPTGIAVDSAGNLYISDAQNFVIREVIASTGIITTVAGNGTEGFSGDGGSATSAELGNIQSVELDAGGNLYIADQSYNSVRRVDAVTGIITSVAGNGQTTGSYTGDSGPATQATLNAPTQAVVDELGDIFISDSGNSVVREVGAELALASFATIAAGTDSPAQNFTLLNEGNAPLVLSAISTSANFDTGGADTTCSGTTTLNASETCIFGLRFAPTTSGNLSGTTTSTDNAFSVFFTGGFEIELSGTATGVDTKLGLGNVPATLLPGGNPGTVTVSVEFANGSVDSAATNAITLMITGPGGVSQTLTGTAINGVASINLSSITLTAVGTYTYSATAASLIAATGSTTIPAPDTKLALGGVPASLAAGENPGRISVSVETASGTVDTTATSTVILMVTGPGGFTHTFTAAAVNGVASFNLSSLALPAAGTYTYSATSGTLTPGVGTTTVAAAPDTKLALGGVPANLAAGGNPGTLTVSVETANGTVDTTATSAVTVTIIGPGVSDTLTAHAVAGVATYNFSGLVLTTAGSYTVTATASSLAQAVGTIVVAPSATTPDFTIAATPLASTPITPGSGTVYTITLAPTATTFPSAITMTATGMPTGATYSFTPATVTPGSGSVTTKLSIAIPQSNAAVALALGVRSRANGLGVLALGVLLLPLAGSRRIRLAARRMPLVGLALAILSLGAVAGLSGCGTGGTSTPSQQAYTLTVTGTSGALVHSTTVTLTVQ